MNDKMLKEPPHCVQCFKEMKFVTALEKKQIPICSHNGCPNYGLLQLGMEIMTDIDKEEEE